jgi:hypothetical protein
MEIKCAPLLFIQGNSVNWWLKNWNEPRQGALVRRRVNLAQLRGKRSCAPSPVRGALFIETERTLVKSSVRGGLSDYRQKGRLRHERCETKFIVAKLYCCNLASVGSKESMATNKLKRKPSAAFMKPVQPDEKLSKVVGNAPLPRTELTKKLWAYIRKNGLQDKKQRTLINADENLQAVFNGKKQVSMFEMTKLVSGHLK